MWFCFASNWTKNLGIFLTDPNRKGFCDPNVTQVIINQVLKRTMFWVETTCWYLIDTTLLFNKNLPPPRFFPTQLICITSVIFPPLTKQKTSPPKKTNTKKQHPTLLMEIAAAGGVNVNSPGKYYRNRSTEVTYVPAKSRWLQTGCPHQSEVGTVGCGWVDLVFRGVLWEVAVRCIVRRFV